MSRTKQIMVKGMNKIMLDCNAATLLITKSEFVKLSCMEQVKLKMHLASCKFCRRFKIQSEFISLQIHKLNENIDKNQLRVYLTEEQKERLKKSVSEAGKKE